MRKFVELGLHQIRKNELFQRKSYFGDFENEKIRYCLVCGVDQQEFMRKCFIQAGIINKEDPDNRVTFTTKSEATAYTYLYWQDRSKMYMVSGQNYLFCDIGYSSISISEIQADVTSSMSKVTLITECNDAGFGSLDQKFKKYLEFRFRDKVTTIASAMSEFEEDIKVIYFLLSFLVGRGRVVYSKLIKSVINSPLLMFGRTWKRSNSNPVTTIGIIGVNQSGLTFTKPKTTCICPFLRRLLGTF